MLTGQDVKGNTPFHIAARMTGSLGTYLKEFVNLYSDKVFLKISHTWCGIDAFQNFEIPCYKWLFKELLLKNEQDQNPFHIAAKSGKTDNNIYTSFLFFRESGDGGISPSERCWCFNGMNFAILVNFSIMSIFTTSIPY